MQAPRRWSGRFLWQNVENHLHKREGDYHNITQNIVIKIFLNTKYGICGFFVNLEKNSPSPFTLSEEYCKIIEVYKKV
mgnify:CR=1 FL=1